MLVARVQELLHQQYPLWLGLLVFCAVLMVAVLSVLAQRRQRLNQQTELLAEMRIETLALQNEYQHVLESQQRVEQHNQRLQDRLEIMQQQKTNLEVELARGRARWQEKEAAFNGQLSLLQSARESLSREFENVANRLFEEKQQHFTRVSKTQLDSAIDPFQRQLRDFYQRVDEFHRQDIAQRNQLMGQISQLQKQSQQIGEDAINLANALKGSNKAQGSWGELVLDRVLEQAGLVKGREFETQVSFEGADGSRLQPDAVIHLPEKKQIVVDAKVSLLAYERFVNAEHEQQRTTALKEHTESVRAHIKNLAGKRYAELIGIETLDFVCMFVPVEAAFVAVAQYSPSVLQEAYEQKIILVSPSSLLLVLKTIDCLWQRERQDKNVELIVGHAGKLYDQFVRFMEAMNEVGACLGKANQAHQRALGRLSEGRGNLIKRAEDLRELGAKTARKLPADMVLEAQQNAST